MRRASTLLLSLALAATALTPVRPAAAGPESPTAEEAERAHDLFERSKPLQDTKRYAEAAGLLRQAWSLQHSPDIAANLGMCEAAMGLYRDGAEHLAYAYRHIVAGATPEQRSQIKNALEIMKRQVATVRLNVEPAGAEVKVDGKPIGVAPLPPEVFLEPGERRLEVSAPGHRAETRVVAAKKGEAQGVEIVLAAEGGSSSPVPSVPTPDPVPPSKDAKATPHEGGMSTKTMVLLAEGGLAVLGLGVGVGFLVAKGSAEDERDALKNDSITEVGVNGCSTQPDASICRELRDADDRVDRDATLSTVGFVGGGVALLGLGATWLLWPEPKSDAPRVAFDPLGRRLVVSGSF